MDDVKSAAGIFSKLQHDLQSDFAVIRFAAGNTQKNAEMIHHALDRANERLQAAFMLLKAM